MGLPIKLPNAQSIISAVANTPLVDGAATLMTGAGHLMTRISEDIDFGKVGDAILSVAKPANVVKATGTLGGGTVGYCGGAALGTGIGFAVGGPVGAAIGYGIGMLSGAGTGAVVGYKAGKAVTHVLELPEDAPDVTISRDKNSDVIEAPHYSVR